MVLFPRLWIKYHSVLYFFFIQCYFWLCYCKRSDSVNRSATDRNKVNRNFNFSFVSNWAFFFCKHTQWLWNAVFRLLTHQNGCSLQSWMHLNKQFQEQKWKGWWMNLSEEVKNTSIWSCLPREFHSWIVNENEQTQWPQKATEDFDTSPHS